METKERGERENEEETQDGWALTSRRGQNNTTERQRKKERKGR